MHRERVRLSSHAPMNMTCLPSRTRHRRGDVVACVVLRAASPVVVWGAAQRRCTSSATSCLQEAQAASLRRAGQHCPLCVGGVGPVRRTCCLRRSDVLHTDKGRDPTWPLVRSP
eukprot:939353-Prymnesium_polylepis.1